MAFVVLAFCKPLLPVIGKGCGFDLVILKTAIAPVPD
jgi:hypothetical protein